MRPIHWLLAGLLSLLCMPATAHRLVPNDGTYDNLANALYVDDPALSQLVLHEITAENPQLWLSFHRKVGEPIYFQLGIPDIPGHEDYRPALALLGPGFQGATGLPFDVPEGYGAMVFDSVDAAPTAFDEPFTGTSSLILLEQTITADTDGPYYLVMYHPSAQVGKAWVAIGTREEFGLQDMLGYTDTLETVREFHEVADERLPLLPRVLLIVSRVLGGVLSLFGSRPG